MRTVQAVFLRFGSCAAPILRTDNQIKSRVGNMNFNNDTKFPYIFSLTVCQIVTDVVIPIQSFSPPSILPKIDTLIFHYILSIYALANSISKLKSVWNRNKQLTMDILILCFVSGYTEGPKMIWGWRRGRAWLRHWWLGGGGWLSWTVMTF